MNRRISVIGAATLAACVAISAVLFIYLLGRFGGPTVRFGRPYEVSAYLPNSKDLSVRSDVLDRGVLVGYVQQISLRGDRALVTFSVQGGSAPIHRDATIQVAEKTLLGEAFISLDPGSPDSPALPSGSLLSARQVLPASVEIDQALNALDPRGIDSVKSILASLARGAASPQTGTEVARTLTRLPALTVQLRLLAQDLHGQEQQISDGVIDTRTILTQLGERQAEVQGIVSGASATLGALAARAGALSAGLHELPGLLFTARRTLADARPLLISARPLLGDLRAAAPPLAGALEHLPPVVSHANDLIARLPRFNAAVLPFLAIAQPVLALAQPTATALGPAVRNLVPIVRYLSARANTFTAWFANTAGLSASGDAKGAFARFFLFVQPSTALGFKGGGFETNPYTPPNDALNDQPYSGYPRTCWPTTRACRAAESRRPGPAAPLRAGDPGLPRR